jgi:sugar O-acyltransferase (sialic acid O-acetyltransferase NeuD family)
VAERYVIWGCAGHAKVLAAMVRQRNGRVEALFDRSDVASVLTGVPVYMGLAGFARWADGAAALDEVSGLAAIGGSRGRDRLAVQALFRRYGLRLSAIVHADASVCETARVGAGTQILAHAVVAADAVVGDACILNHRASVDHECRVGDGAHLAPGATLCGLVVLEPNVMIGAGAVVLPRLRIGENSLVGAGAVVTRDGPANTVVVGNPARVLRTLPQPEELP